MLLPVMAAAGGLPVGWSSCGFASLVLGWSASNAIGFAISGAITKSEAVPSIKLAVPLIGLTTINLLALPIIFAGTSMGASLIVGCAIGFAVYATFCGVCLFSRHG